MLEVSLQVPIVKCSVEFFIAFLLLFVIKKEETFPLLWWALVDGTRTLVKLFLSCKHPKLLYLLINLGNSSLHKKIPRAAVAFGIKFYIVWKYEKDFTSTY